jgi:hypothetical protein
MMAKMRGWPAILSRLSCLLRLANLIRLIGSVLLPE